MAAVLPPIMSTGGSGTSTPQGTWGAPTAATIAGGIATLTGPGTWSIDTEAAAASDDLDKLLGLVEGDEVVIFAANDARTIVCKNATFLKIGADFSLNNAYDSITLLCIGSDVCVLKGGPMDNGS